MTKIPDIIWCEVPAGEFIMGSDVHEPEETPQHILNLPYTYYAAKYPVTNTQYTTFVADGGYHEQRYWTAAGWEWKESTKRTGVYNWDEPFNLPNHPVATVSWYEAVAYCRWLTEKLQEHNKLADGWLIRLPTEAEWEKAARGTDGRMYPWGEEFDVEKANGEETKVELTSSVVLFLDGVSPYGCHGMVGNISEWCATQVDSPDPLEAELYPYPYKIKNEWGEDHLASDNCRVLRGGPWFFDRELLHCAVRGYNIPSSDYHGFRCFCVPIF